MRELSTQHQAELELASALQSAVKNGPHSTIDDLERAVSEKLAFSRLARIELLDVSPRLTIYRAKATPDCWLLSLLDARLAIHASAPLQEPAELGAVLVRD